MAAIQLKSPPKTAPGAGVASYLKNSVQVAAYQDALACSDLVAGVDLFTVPPHTLIVGMGFNVTTAIADAGKYVLEIGITGDSDGIWLSTGSSNGATLAVGAKNTFQDQSVLSMYETTSDVTTISILSVGNTAGAIDNIWLLYKDNSEDFS